jgi:tetratricopeptide (TPR) repeat protein
LFRLGLLDSRIDPTIEKRTRFFRRGLADGWRSELDPPDIETIEQICRDAMVQYGYPEMSRLDLDRNDQTDPAQRPSALKDADQMTAAARDAENDKDWSLALAHWEECLAAFPAHVAANSWRRSGAFALIRLGRLEDAERIFKALDDEFPDRPWGLAGLARIAGLKNEPELALERWNDVIRRFGGSHANLNSWRAEKARALETLDLWRQAVDLWREMAAETVADPQSAMGQARCLFKLEGPSDLALQAALVVMESLPDHLPDGKPSRPFAGHKFG